MQSIDLLLDVYRAATTVRTKNGKFTTVNQLTDQTPALTPEVLVEAVDSLIELGPITHDIKILSEDDKGAILAGIFAYLVGRPLAMARKYPYSIPGSQIIGVKMEYDDFQTTVNGLCKGDRIMIIDDTLASGGTAEALIEACNDIGAEVEEVRVITEKLGYGGRARLEKYGVIVRAVLGIRVSDEGAISVEQTWGTDL